MVSVCIYFQVHQPHRLRKYSVFDIGRHMPYFDEELNKNIISRVVNKCYIPMCELLYSKVKQLNGRFKVAFSITGTVLEQLENHSPETIRLFQRLVNTGAVELLSETYHHTLASLYSESEFKEQVRLHSAKIKSLFGVQPKVFRNTELIFSNRIAELAEQMGYKAILAEGAEKMLGWRSPNHIYRPKGTRKLKALLKNYKLSDDIAFRFSDRSWKEYPIDAPKFAQWISADQSVHCTNLFMDFETFGEHQWASTGIFNFMDELPDELLRHPANEFLTPSELASKYEPVDLIESESPVSWADIERDTTAWNGNAMQRSALGKIYLLEQKMQHAPPGIVETWRRLQTSDHFYYMCTKWFADGDVHKYFNPYDNPYECYISLMNILNDFEILLKKSNESELKANILQTVK